VQGEWDLVALAWNVKRLFVLQAAWNGLFRPSEAQTGPESESVLT
jgi:hypothetical protein